MTGNYSCGWSLHRSDGIKDCFRAWQALPCVTVRFAADQAGEFDGAPGYGTPKSYFSTPSTTPDAATSPNTMTLARHKNCLPRAAPVVKRQPVANKASGNVEDDRGLLAVMGFMLAEHCPDVGHAQSLELAMPLPGMLAVGPAVFEGNAVRFHDEPPAHLEPHGPNVAGFVNQYEVRRSVAVSRRRHALAATAAPPRSR
jgi:hypothetical protein